ncbi:MAG: L-lactate dehydrogenase [archaeon]|nr:L-lactate dehydrogenase [archaeon]
MKSNVMIIGAGSVGTTIAYALMIKSIARHIYLVDINEQKVEGEVLDLNHCRSFVSSVEVHHGHYSDCNKMDMIIITAGAKQKVGETRIELLTRNIGIMKKIMDSIKEYLETNKPIILIVSNPVDILTYFAHKFSGLPKGMVFGSGTVLDSSRLRFEISNYCNIDAKSIHGYIIGEHGDTELALWSSITIGSQKFKDYCFLCDRNTRCIEDKREVLFENAKNAAYSIIDAKGFTNFAIGLATSLITQAVLRNQHTVLPVSSILSGQYGLNDVSISLPCIIGSKGVEKVIEVSMEEEELQKFKKSANHLKGIIGKTKI